MTPTQVKSSYARALRDTVVVRRYSGTGTNRPQQNVPARARIIGMAPEELIGTIEQLGRKVIVYADDVAALAPLTMNDKIVYDGREYAIVDTDDATRRVNGVLVAYELLLKG